MMWFAQRDQQRCHGLSLIELTMILALTSVVVTAIYQSFHTQQRAYQRQNAMSEIQQSLRASTYTITRELRGAGYDPQRTGQFGIVSQFNPPHDTFTINYATDTTTLAFTMDDDEDGGIDTNLAEMVAYRFNQAQRLLERFNVTGPTTNAWTPIANNIDAVNFVYYDNNGIQTFTPDRFRHVEISLLIRAGGKDLKYNNTNIYRNKLNQNICPSCTTDHYRRQMWSTTVQIRNTP